MGNRKQRTGRKKKGQHLDWNDRLTIEKLLDSGFRPPEIAGIIGCCRATIYNEIKRATYVHTNSNLTEEIRYCPDQAEERYQQHLREKGAPLKIYNDDNLAKYIAYKIGEEKYSPEAVLLEIRREGISFDVEIRSVNTIYNYIRQGVFQGISLKNLPVLHRKKQKKKKVVRYKRVGKGKSITQRPEEVLTREEFGHWEMDSVIGAAENEKALLVLTERKTRGEIIEILNSGRSEEVKRAISRVKQRFQDDFYLVFKSITVDNGGEFRNVELLESALCDNEEKVDLYYCHPYRSCERGSNENQNRLIRRWFPKGSNFDSVLNHQVVKLVEDWMNNYPRRMFNGDTSAMLFQQECHRLTAG
jgi:IS30 family transposase